MSPMDFLERKSGKIVALGDTFDLKRCSKKMKVFEYWEYTKKWHKHLKYMIPGNHDYKFLLYFQRNQKVIHENFVKLGPVLCFHGHQQYCGVGTGS